jgi:hypothetical protein
MAIFFQTSRTLDQYPSPPGTPPHLPERWDSGRRARLPTGPGVRGNRLHEGWMMRVLTASSC